MGREISSNSKQNKRTKRKGNKQSFSWKKIGKIALSIFLVCVILGSVGITALVVYAVGFFSPDDAVDLSAVQLSYSTVIYGTDQNGKEYEISRIYRGENREWVDLQDIPQHVRDAFIYTEDERFMSHEGVDWKRTVSSFANLIFGFWDTKQGGSTITQQLIKNVTGDRESRGLAGIKRKVQEIFRALSLEKKYYKDEILENYLNIIHLGYSTGGVQAAAKYYFGKDIRDVTIAEAASLAATTRSPATRNPKANPELNQEKRAYVLGKMLEFDAITQEEYEQALQEQVQVVDAVDRSDEEPQQNKQVQSWYVDNVIEQVLDDMVAQLGYSRDEAETMLYSGGYRIYTPMDQSLQSLLEEKYRLDKTFYSRSVQNAPDSAMVVMNYNGEILALVGGRGEKQGDRLYNLATMAKRPCGSSIKPLAVYAPAVEENLIHYSSLVTDEPIQRNVGESPDGVWPHNYTKKWYGDILIPEALYRSLNTIPVNLIEMLTPQKSFNFLRDKLGFTTLVEREKKDGKIYSDASLSLALGSFTHGLHLTELTAAYQVFGNGGYYIEPHAYTKVVDSFGDVLLEKQPKKVKAMTEETATIMNRLLINVISGGDNATGRAAKISGMEVIGKTGTTQDNKDQTFVGATPELLAGIWVGHRDNTPILTNTSYSPAQIFNNVLGSYISKMSVKKFELDADVQVAQYCVKTGLLATEACAETATGYYKADNLPSRCHDKGNTKPPVASEPTVSSEPSAEVPGPPPGSSGAGDQPPLESTPSVSSEQSSVSSENGPGSQVGPPQASQEPLASDMPTGMPPDLQAPVA